MKKLILLITIIVFTINIYPLSGPAIDFNAVDIDGKNIKLSEFKGKVVILDFWATWCPPCLKEIPNLKKIYTKFKDDDFEIISIALERKPREHALKFVADKKMNWVHVIDKLKGREIATEYRIRYIPTMYIINKKGEIIESGLRGESLGEKIAELLK
ncbi:MAG: TlpA disulfide reductase family protein [Acidobacteriota bacterium]